MSQVVHRDAWRGLPDLFDWLEGLPGFWMAPGRQNMRAMRVEEFAEDDKFVVRAELPGIDPEKDVTVEVAGGVLTIHAERHELTHGKGRSEFQYGAFTRQLSLPQGVDEASVTARYVDGILEVTIPLPSKQVEAKKVPVERVG